MAKLSEKADVLIVGDHPAAFLAAVMLRQKSKLRIIHVTVPGSSQPDRLVRLNPDFFSLHPVLSPLRRKIDQTVIYGLQFLSADDQTRSEWRTRGTVVTVASLKQVRTTLAKLAADHEVELHQPKTLSIEAIDEEGMDVQINNASTRVKGLIVSDGLDETHRRLLSISETWEGDVLHRLTWVRVKGAQKVDLGGKPLAAVSLDLQDQEATGWLLPGGSTSQLMVLESAAKPQDSSPDAALRLWAEVLVKHGILSSVEAPEWAKVQSMHLPLAGALAHEGIGDRTLLIGPAGGFYSASGEDIYPNCWSALYAAEVMKKSLREPHLQDALNAYRARWRTTLGDYLRGPQQNLRFLLPLVYRNPVMTQRLAEAILLGRSVVR